MPITGSQPLRRKRDNAYYGGDDEELLKILETAGQKRSWDSPDDKSIKTLFFSGLDARISEQDLRVHLNAYGEIAFIRMALKHACAFVTYRTRESAEKAAYKLSNKLVIKGLELKVTWVKPKSFKGVPEQNIKAGNAIFQPAIKRNRKTEDIFPLDPPQNDSIKTLYVARLGPTINEQDLKKQFCAHGEIESIKMELHFERALVTFKTREGAEKAAEELFNKLVIKGMKLRLMWDRPEARRRLDLQDSQGTTSYQS